MQKIITKQEFQNKIKELLKDFEVIGPKEFPVKGVFYQPLRDAEDLYTGEAFAVEPIKKFFLNPSQCLLEAGYKDGSWLLKDISLSENKRIIIGARPCETRGLCLLDNVYDSEYKDSSYINNRKRTIIVGLACARPDNSCFCASMGGSPVESRGMDAMLFKTGDGFIVEIVTDKAKELLGSIGKEMDGDAKKTLESSKEACKKAFKKNLKIPDAESLDRVFESNYWDRVSMPCISCGVCTYLCPTCHCFDLVDEDRKRLRCYDGCAFKDFTLQASGENSRPSKKQRYRQRVFHKFGYFKKNFGENLCVGCGRCIRHCPVKMDISEIVTKIP